MMGANYQTKKELKAAIGQPLRYEETSFFGPEYKADGTFCVVVPSPTQRKWFASVTMQNGVISQVK
jgi:cytochrome c biogenesis protein ResB